MTRTPYTHLPHVLAPVFCAPCVRAKLLSGKESAANLSEDLKMPCGTLDGLDYRFSMSTHNCYC